MSNKNSQQGVRETIPAKEVLKVMLWGMEVGRLAWHEGRLTSYFTYNPAFLRGTQAFADTKAENNKRQ